MESTIKSFHCLKDREQIVTEDACKKCGDYQCPYCLNQPLINTIMQNCKREEQKLCKLHCFSCGHRFEYFDENARKIVRNKIWRWDNRPYCDDCIRDSIECLYLDDDLVQWFMDMMDTDQYKRNFNKFRMDVMIIRCPNPKCRCFIYVWKLEKNHNGTLFKETGSEMDCPDCHYYFEFDKHGKILQFATNEDEYYTKFNKPEIPSENHESH